MIGAASKSEVEELRTIIEELKLRIEAFGQPRNLEEEAFEKKRVTDLVTSSKFLMQANEALQADITKIKLQFVTLESYI